MPALTVSRISGSLHEKFLKIIPSFYDIKDVVQFLKL